MNHLLFSCFIINSFGIYLDALVEKPTLIPSDSELKIKEGDELRIQCYSKLQTPLYFSYPEHTFMSPRSAHEIWSAKNGTLTFLRRSAVSLDTGWYACAAEGVEIENDFKNLNHTHKNIAWIYVYVLSSEPFADRYYTFPKTIIILAGSPGIVPCRPTSPDLDVKLWRNFRMVDSNEQIQFDPKIGFILQKPLSPRDLNSSLNCIFHCKANDTEDVYVLRYSNATGRRPTINSTSDELFLHLGDELRIKCYSGTNIQFAFPAVDIMRAPAYDKPTSEYNIFSDGKGESTFLRRAVILQDMGWYGCAEEGINPNMPPFYIEYTKKEINWIYVYIESNDTIWLNRKSMPVPMNLDTSMLIPCLITSPRFNVKLKSKSGVMTLDENVKYHPKLGFILRRGPSLTQEDCYECVVQDQDLNASTSCFKLHGIFNSYSQRIYQSETMLLTGEDLHLGCEADSPEMVSLEWNIPTTVSEERVEFSLPQWFDITKAFAQHFEVILTIKNVTKNEGGRYECAFRNAVREKNTSVNIDVYDRKSVDYMELGKYLKTHDLVGLHGENVIWMINCETKSLLRDLMWITPSNILLRHANEICIDRFDVQRSSNLRELFQIHNLTFGDTGLYRAISTHVFFDGNLNINLHVHAPPTVTIQNKSEPYYSAPGEIFSIYSEITGSPSPEISWNFTSHPEFRSDNDSFSTILSNYYNVFIDEYNQVSNLNTSTYVTGNLTCTACNYLKCSSSSKRILVSDGDKGFTIIGPKETAYLGDDVALTCAVPIYAFRNLSWDVKFSECYKNVNRTMFHTDAIRTKYTIQQVIHMKNVTQCHQRSYSCWGQTINGDLENSSYYLQLISPEKPYFIRNNLNRSQITFSTKSPDITTKSLYCCAGGSPSPNISWFQDNIELEKSPAHQHLPGSCELVIILRLLSEEGRRYGCKAENRFGEIRDYVDFVTEDENAKNENLAVIFISVVVIFIVFLAAWLVIRRHRRKLAKRRFKEAILQRFDEGALNRLNPKLDIVDQAEVLPYDEEWEYPRELLTFEKILGSGAFGIVKKATAKSIRPGEPFSTVAVKMVRATFKLHQMMALSRELKILIYLGQHVNIVNLLGACTKNVSYGELFVIVEFCRFGNLHDYLSRNRADFIDQIDPTTGEINTPGSGTDHISADEDDADMNCDDVSDSCHSTDSGAGNGAAEEETSSNAFVAPGLRSTYEGDYNMDDNMGPIRTKDLLSWAWQVSRGMRYLGERKVVHGDLAARNVLLADNNVIKICDFGLAKALYKDDHFKKGGEDPLPLKWMAIESIENRLFSIQSDIWSYGIFLWELFTLAKTPYPEIHPKFVYKKLSNGYRMSQPKHAPNKIYHIMMKCWEAEPGKRPSFAEIEYIINELLDESVTEFYEDLSSQYTEVNAKILASGKTDYLTMDPSQEKAVYHSAKSEEVEFSNVSVDDTSKLFNPNLSSIAENDESNPSLV